MSLTEPFDWGEPISVYSRAQALEDGVLVDVSEWAGETGYRRPTVMTAALWHDVDADSRPHAPSQSTRGRAHDVLVLGRMALMMALRHQNDHAEFEVKLSPHTYTVRVVLDGDGITLGYPEDF